MFLSFSREQTTKPSNSLSGYTVHRWIWWRSTKHVGREIDCVILRHFGNCILCSASGKDNDLNHLLANINNKQWNSIIAENKETLHHSIVSNIGSLFRRSYWLCIKQYLGSSYDYLVHIKKSPLEFIFLE